MFRRHPIITTLCLIFLALAGLVGYLAATFDLSGYRHQLAGKLSQALQTPVSLGDAHLSLSRGLAVAFDDLMIGDDHARVAISAAHLSLRIEIIPLLQRRLSFSGVILDTPRVVLRAGDAASAEAQETVSPATSELSLAQRAKLKALDIHNGRFEWHREDADGDKPALILQNIDLHLGKLALAQSTQVSLSANLVQNGRVASFEISGNLEPPADWGRWIDWRIKLKGQGRHLALTALQNRGLPDLSLSGTVDLNIELAGTAAGGIAVQSRIDGRDLKRTTAGAGHAIPRLSAAAEGSLRWEEAHWRLTLDQAKVNQWPIAGPLHLVQAPSAWRLQGAIASGRIPAAEIGTLMHAFAGWPAGDARNFRVTGGTLARAHLAFDGPWPETAAAWLGPTGTLRSFELEGDGLGIDLPQSEIKQGRIHLAYRSGQLTIDQGELHWQQVPCRFRGQVSNLGSSEAQLDLQVRVTTTADRLTPLFAGSLPPGLDLTGPLSATLALKGPLQQPRFDLKADLSPMVADWGDFLVKTRQTPADFQIAGTWRERRLEIAAGKIRLGPLQAGLTGKLETADSRTFGLSLQLATTDLSRLEQLAAPLQRFKLEGKLQGTLELAGSAGQFKPPKGEFLLEGGGAHFGDIVADLNGTRGRILLTGSAVRAPELTTQLGQSRFRVSAQIPDLTEPRLKIDLRGQNLRPRDLIFTGEAQPLKLVEGTLVIDRGGIDFTPVRARTAGGTVATVTGAVHSFSSPRVELKIDAEYGNVDEILEFFHRSADERRAQQDKPARTTVRIEVAARAGLFHQIQFGRANATVTYRDRVLEIYPLHAELQPGYYVGRVLWAATPEKPPLLKVSGHLENVDAEAAYRGQTQQHGLVTGTLRGDFYLEGAGDNFWPTSYGGIALAVEDGVLRRFKVLSKVFSVLNVSQIFSLKLPDMAQQGMPFNRIDGNLQLVEGVLSSEDVLVDSDAMNLSMVGEIDLVNNTIDATLGVKPLGTVDKIVSKIPIAGWILGGEEKALITAHFRIRGSRADPEVYPVPISSVSQKVLGIFKRVLGLPGKVISDIGRAVEGDDQAEP